MIADAMPGDGGKSRAVAWCLTAYMAAGYVALGTGYCLADRGPIAIAFWADVAATLTIFAFSFRFDNSSFYDPYWSVAPLPIALYWSLSSASPELDLTRQSVVLALLALWGVRLTYNWYRGWTGLDHEDWRYLDLRRKTGSYYWPASLIGLHMVPTLVVFVACLAVFPAVAKGTGSFGVLDAVALAVAVAGIGFEALADQQLRRFRMRPRDPEDILETGLWAYSRHPNYFGELSFWWGMWLFAVAAAPSYWWTVVGPIVMTLLFQYASLPLIERRMLESRPAYAERTKRVSAIVPRPPR
jgi:steroid 5-alpha reductase family enzyme